MQQRIERLRLTAETRRRSVSTFGVEVPPGVEGSFA
jgi:hypothetical protein